MYVSVFAVSEVMGKLEMNDTEIELRLAMMRKLVAQPIPKPPWSDPEPALIGDCVLIGNKHHAANVEHLVRLGVTAVLNCASSGISRLPIDELEKRGIRYAFTNVQDHYQYPILQDKTGAYSKHLQVANSLYLDVREAGGKVLFFCVAGQNRSAALAIACLMLGGKSLDDILKVCSEIRSFVLENVGFQRQLVELEATLGRHIDSADCRQLKKQRLCSPRHSPLTVVPHIEVELLVPGLCTMEVKIPINSTIASVKEILVSHVNQHLLALTEPPAHVAKSWIVLAMFGFDDKYDLPLEEEAIAFSVQVARMRSMFGLTIVEDGANSLVTWTEKCRFALVIFTVVKDTACAEQEPWIFQHVERPGAPATLLENTLRSTHLRAWDFETGQAYDSKQPIVFSFGDGPGDKRAFMEISSSDQMPQQFNAPGEGGILGMGANAIVHRVELRPIVDNKPTSGGEEHPVEEDWDAAVKRSFSVTKMLTSLEKKSEAGTAKRLRLANRLNKQGRILYFYGLGVALSSNSKNHHQYKFELALLSKYQEEFSSYTMKKFMSDYTTVLADAPPEARADVQKLQADFSLIKVKELLVSLLSGFRDLTLMGVQAFDFNHLSNVLISRDHRRVRLIDIDGNSKGSIQFTSEDTQGSQSKNLVRPALDIDLHAILPKVVQQLILGKGRGNVFVTQVISQIWQASSDEDARTIIKETIRQNFYPSIPSSDGGATEKLLCKVTMWFLALLKKRVPWANWTNDIYDAMRCIDHLPIT